MIPETPAEDREGIQSSKLFVVGMIVIASFILIVTRDWTLQAFVPEPYFLRAVDQLAELSSPRGPSDIPRSLAPLHTIIAVETILLAAMAVAALLFFSKRLAIAYALVIVGMALTTLLRLGAAFQGIH